MRQQNSVYLLLWPSLNSRNACPLWARPYRAWCTIDESNAVCVQSALVCCKRACHMDGAGYLPHSPERAPCSVKAPEARFSPVPPPLCSPELTPCAQLYPAGLACALHAPARPQPRACAWHYLARGPPNVSPFMPPLNHRGYPLVQTWHTCQSPVRDWTQCAPSHFCSKNSIAPFLLSHLLYEPLIRGGPRSSSYCTSAVLLIGVIGAIHVPVVLMGGSWLA